MSGELNSSEISHIRDLGPAVWVGATSFEARCSAGLAALEGAVVTDAFIVRYRTDVRPLKRSREAVASNTRGLRDIASRSGSRIGILTINPYQIGSIQGCLDNAERTAERNAGSLVIDVTCLTKAHTVAVADWIRSHSVSVPVFIQYTPPAHYGRWAAKTDWDFGYRPPMYAPFGKMTIARMSRPRTTVALAVMGHEGVRLAYAMSIFHADLGLALLSYGSRRDDALLMAEVENASFLDEIAPSVGDTWRRETVSVLDFDRAPQMLADVLDLGQSKSEHLDMSDPLRLVLVPLGPKLTILSFALAMLNVPDASCWISYPIPGAYRLEYSYGHEKTVYASVAK